MKHNKFIILSALLALSAVTPAEAQIDAADSTQVNVAFRKVAKEDIMGGVSSLNYRDLMDKNYNTYSLDNMQGYVAGFNGASMWGYNESSVTDPVLVLIDGVPRDANNVLPSEIEEITFLKGAQAVVLYGSRGAKGVIMITTKRGRVTDGLKVEARVNTGWHVAKATPEYLGSAEYMTLYNEARANDGLSALYTADEIANYASGRNPYRYPDVDFYSSEYLKKAYNRTDATVEIEGGNDRAKFYSNVSYYRFGDYFNFGEAKNNYTDRFNARGNVDVRINNYISAYVNANATFYNAHSAISQQKENNNTLNYWQVATKWRPNRITPLIPVSYIDPTATDAMNILASSNNIIDGKYFFGAGKASDDWTNIFADYYAAGKSTWVSRQFQFDAGLNIDLGSVLKGLTFHALMGVDYQTSYSLSYNNEYATFEPTWSDDGGSDIITALNNHETVDRKSGNQNLGGGTDNQTITFNAHFDYNRTFANVHNVSAILVANGYQTTKSGQYHKISNANLGVQASYNYDHKYYLDAAVALPWTAKLAAGHRAGVSPSVTLGWNIAKEKFMEGGIFDNLTLSVSGSSLKTDLDIVDYSIQDVNDRNNRSFYMHLGAYQSGGWYDWNGLTGFSLVQSRRGGNEALGYVKRNEFSTSIHAELLQRSLSFDASFYMSVMNGGIITASNQLPSYFKVYYPESSFLSYLNYNKDERTGFDLSLNYKKNFGDFGFEGGVNMSYYTTKASKRDDNAYEDTYQYREGKALDAIWGYECLGFYRESDFDADGNLLESLPTPAIGGTIKPGDLMYKDQNGDGIIDTKDQVDLGKGGWYGAPMTLGVNLTFKYKNFTLFLLGIGGFGGHGVKNNSYWWISGNEKYTAAVRDRWTPETANTAKYPRLSTQNAANNKQTSDFWMYSTSRFDLSKVQLTYDFPKNIIGDGIVKGLSVYVSGNSLLTFAKERKLLEMNVGEAPQSRFYNIGAKVCF